MTTQIRGFWFAAVLAPLLALSAGCARRTSQRVNEAPGRG